MKNWQCEKSRTPGYLEYAGKRNEKIKRDMFKCRKRLIDDEFLRQNLSENSFVVAS